MEAALALPLETEDLLREKVAHLERVRDQQNAKLLDLEADLDESNWNNRGVKESVRDLAGVRALIRDGDNKEALYQLERVLSELDSGWRVHA